MEVNNTVKIINGDCLTELDKLDANVIDCIVTDPPYELNFMGKGWDNAGVSFSKLTWKKCLRVLKPGGYLVAFGGTRTYHRIACAIEDAGFEIRDCIMWLYGSGFPKSMSISKGIEAREKYGKANTVAKRQIEQDGNGREYKVIQTNNGAMGEKKEFTRKEYTPQLEKAKEWQGWGTCLKPAYEPIIVARKPFKGSLIDNVLANGVGGLNIDECRVPITDEKDAKEYHFNNNGNMRTVKGDGEKLGAYDGGWKIQKEERENPSGGRFPANVILTYDETDKEEVCGGFPKSKGGSGKGFKKDDYGFGDTATNFKRGDFNPYNDNGSAARYFYCAKASKRDREEGIGITNNHPTVKPTSLMRYLIKLVAPKGATILDPFMGSGSTGKACMLENKENNKDYNFIGIEKDAEYCQIAEARIKYAEGKDEELE